jgi:hypothetical protein
MGNIVVDGVTMDYLFKANLEGLVGHEMMDKKFMNYSKNGNLIYVFNSCIYGANNKGSHELIFTSLHPKTQINGSYQYKNH